MEIAVMSDPLQLLSKHIFHQALSSNHLSAASAGNLQISALLTAIDAVAPPPVRSTTSSLTGNRILRKRRLGRTRRRRHSSGGSNEDGLFDGEGGGGDDGPIDGSGGGGGGGWNYDGFGAFGWDDSSSSPSDPAFDFVYEVVCWLVFSNCLHFAFKKVARLLAAGISDYGREKVPVRIVEVC